MPADGKVDQLICEQIADVARFLDEAGSQVDVQQADHLVLRREDRRFHTQCGQVRLDADDRGLCGRSDRIGQDMNSEIVLADGEVLSLEKIASEINQEHDLFLVAASDALTHAIRCGLMLMSVQDTMPRGEFMAWVGEHTNEGHCNFNYATGWKYIKLCQGAKSKTFENEISIKKALRAVCSLEKEDKTVDEPPPCPDGQYTLVLADPPWQYDCKKSYTRTIDKNQYATADPDSIIGMKPGTADDCILFLWATAPLLPEALAVMAGWGFQYKSQAIWDKEIIGMGFWFRGQHELLLVGVKGDVHPPEEGNRCGSVFREKRGDHSVKPDCIYEWIEKAFPGFVKLEMFSRRAREGWTVWGNEV